jgi:hypothetical protein
MTFLAMELQVFKKKKTKTKKMEAEYGQEN